MSEKKEKKAVIRTRNIKAFIEDNGSPVTVGKIARRFGCSKPTVRNSLRSLRKEGEPMIPTRKGIMFADNIPDGPSAKILYEAMQWLGAMLVGAATIAEVGRKPLLQAVKLLEFPEERKKARALLRLLINAIDLVDVEHQLTE